MDLETILADVRLIATVGQLAISVGVDAAPFITQVYNSVTGKSTLSDADRADLLEREKGLRARLQAPLPPEEDQPAG